MINAYNPYWWAAFAGQRKGFQNQSALGVFKLTTSGVELNSDESTVDYGVNPASYMRLPNECLVLLTISSDVPDGGTGYPVYIIVPGGDTTTLASSCNTSRLPLVDAEGEAVKGSDVSAGLQKIALLNRQQGILKFVTE